AFLSFVILLAIFACIGRCAADNVTHDGRALIINGHRRIIISGSIHYPRSTVEMWADLISKAKHGGLDAIETYVFWNAHEPVRRAYDFSNNLDLIRFIKTVRDAGLYAVVRIGPYVCAEWNYGGFPVWLHNLAGGELRTTNEVFMNEMQTFTTLIVDMLKKEKLFASQGGPIILAQIENEYGDVMSAYGDAGKAYVNWCAAMADSLEIGVPWIMCKQADAPPPMINTCNGWYCHEFTPNNPNSPKMWTENWTGWFKSWGGRDPHRTAEDVAYAVARFFQRGGIFQNYYMYHGGTNFGRSAGGPYITTSYDYDAPLDEYGGLNQPKYGHLKQLHRVLHSIEKQLTDGNVTDIDYGNSVTATVYALPNGRKSCFLGNANSTTAATVVYGGVNYTVPAWSVSILPDCKREVYNTAKVKTQTTVMAREGGTQTLKWEWRREALDDAVLFGKGQSSSKHLWDQKAIDDASDYLWYMTSVDLEEEDPLFAAKNMSIQVNTTGQIVHAYVNGRHVGSNWSTYGDFKTLFSKEAKFRKGKNQISLLSATVGLQNYGSFYDMMEDGIVGPVQIVGIINGDESITKDLSKHKWNYQVGLRGLKDARSVNVDRWTTSEPLPVNRMMTWYRAAFESPPGEDPVAVDLKGMGKGYAWVNGNSLGRYWPSFLADENGCSDDPCDYRGAYDNNKCVYNCGKPTQRYYHVPRSFLNAGGHNELVLFEEFGGNPTSHVGFKTLRPGSVCATAKQQNQRVTLSCHGRRISAIKFASYGDPNGTCGSFQKGTCESSKDAVAVLQFCVGKETCTFIHSDQMFGATDCAAAAIDVKLVVEAVC
ncbi:hypothetical protein M569_00825, partial [Genlisea aurea]